MLSHYQDKSVMEKAELNGLSSSEKITQDEVKKITADKAVDYVESVSHADGSSEEAWLDDDDDGGDNDIELHNEWKLRRDKFYNDGYRDGIVEGQKDAAQEGFNLGFKDSVMLGYKWGIVRGITSALAHIPDELKRKLVEKEDVQKEFLNLHDQVASISTENALRLYYNKIMRENSEDQSDSVNNDPCVTDQSDCGGLKTLVGNFEVLLKESTVINVGSDSKESNATN